MADLAFIVLARNDLDNNNLQIHDLKPNTSLANPTLERVPQTGYLTHYIQNDTVATSGSNPVVTTAIFRGLAAYLLDNVECVAGTGGGNTALTATQANAMAAAILDRVATGSSLTLSDINTVINAVAGVDDSDLDGTVADSESTGSVLEVLKILSGAVYELPAASAVGGNSNAFPGSGSTHTRLGYFATAPNKVPDLGPAAWHVGQSIFAFPAPTQTGTKSTAYRPLRQLVETGELHLSVLGGNLSQLVASTFAFTNPAFTYGASGTALNIGGDHIPSTGIGRGVVVYDDDGNVIA